MGNWLKFLIPVTVIFLIFWLGSTLGQTLTTPKPGAEYQNEIKRFNKEAINSLTLQDKEGTIEIKRVDDGWQLEGRKVLDLKVSELVEAIFSTDKVFSLISQSPSRQGEFEVASASARRLTLRNKDQKSLTLFIGKYSYPGNFVRIEGSNNTYLSPSVLDVLVKADSQLFWDKTVLKIEKNKIQKFSISIQKGAATFTVIKEGDKYLVEKSKKELNLDKVNQYLNDLTLLQGDKILTDKKEKTKYPKFLGEVTIETMDQKEMLKIYSGKDNDLLERTSDGELLTLSSPDSAALFKPQSEFE